MAIQVTKLLDSMISARLMQFSVFFASTYISSSSAPRCWGFWAAQKRIWKTSGGMMVAGNNHIDKEDFLHLYPPARKAAFTKGNICSGFAGAGIKSLNQDRVLEKITFQLRTPTPPPNLTEGSISSAFQTPQNPRQLGHKVRSLQRSLRKKRTLSSSPVSYCTDGNEYEPHSRTRNQGSTG